MGWQWSISSEAQAARWPPQALASSRMSLLMTSSFFCASPWMLPVPASPSTPPSAPLPTAIEILVQARATTAISWRRSALMRPARCSSIRWRVRETAWRGLDMATWGWMDAAIVPAAAGESSAWQTTALPMTDPDVPETTAALLLSLSAALGAGLLVGLVRERGHGTHSTAGLRTHALVALATAVAAWLGTGVLLVALAAVALLAAMSYHASHKEDPGLTGEVALLATALLGALALR